MDIQTEKLEIMKMILETNNPKILSSIKKLFKKENSVDLWETLSQDQMDEIRMGTEEMENGETIDY